MNPTSARPLLNAASMRVLLEKLLRKPINGTGGCCACVQTGNIAAEPARVTMNSRRLIDLVFGSATLDCFFADELSIAASAHRGGQSRAILSLAEDFHF